MMPLTFKKIVIAIAALFAVVWVYHFIMDSVMTKTIELPPMHTHAVGRYLIDLPTGFELDNASYLTLYYGLDKYFNTVEVEVVRTNGNQPTLAQIVQTEVNALRGDFLAESPTKNKLAEVKQINDHMTLVRAYKVGATAFTLHLYAQIGNSVVMFAEDGYDGKDKDYQGKDYEFSHLPDVEARLLKVAQNTTYAANPAEQGKGTSIGPIAINAGQDGEVLAISFFDEKRPDIGIHINMNSLTQHGDGGLLHRADSAAGMLAKLDVTSTTLRRGDTTIGGRPAQELLDQGKDNDKIVRLFTAETGVSSPSTPAKPVIAISMDMGGQIFGGEYVDSSLSRYEALAWWDAIVKSIRPRPGAI